MLTGPAKGASNLNPERANELKKESRKLTATLDIIMLNLFKFKSKEKAQFRISNDLHTTLQKQYRA